MTLSARPVYVLAFALSAVGLARYLYNLPHVFDLALDDEVVYMGVGTDFSHLLLWPADFKGIFSSYEPGGLYSYIYRAISPLFTDPIDLYTYGGMVIVLSAVVIGIVSTLCLSDSALLAVAMACAVTLSGELMTWPRVSFAAISIIAIGFATMSRAVSLRIKVAILLCTAYLATFVRPEFVLSFYILLALQLGILLELPLRRRRRRKGLPDPTRSELIAVAAAPVFVVTMSSAWSFPLFSGGERAFVAFGQHYAVLFAAAHKFTIDPWIDWRVVITDQFPDAHTVFQAILTQPGRMLAYFGMNLEELGSSVAQIALSTITGHAGFALVAALCGALWVGSALYRRNGTPNRALRPARRALLDLGLISAFALPPLIATVTVFPRHHYILLLLFMISSAIAVLARPLRAPLEPILAPALAAVFLFSADPLPIAPQPILESVLALRAQPPVHRMFEIDGGWCYFMMPRCIEEYADWMPDLTSFDAYRREHGIDSVMLSPRLRIFEATHNPGFPTEIGRLSTDGEWQATDLGHGYVLLRAPP